MSSFPSRPLEIWKSTLASDLGELKGAFCFHLTPAIMVPQTMEYLFERQGQQVENGNLLNPFTHGMRYFDKNTPSNLFWWKNFPNSDELFSFDLVILESAIRQLELHTDINLTYSQVTYLADVGTGPNLPLMVVKRVPIARGVGFEVEERGRVSISLAGGDIALSDKVHVAQQHYSTGMGLLAGEDSLAGLIDAAFMQFYLALEALLENHEKEKAISRGKELYGERFTADFEALVKHIYLARHRFFGHAHPKFLKGLLDAETAFQIAKQTLVARWTARGVLALELNRPLVTREMVLYPKPNYSISFNGDPETLVGEFCLP